MKKLLKFLFWQKKEEVTSSQIFLVVGLGNPGKKYKDTRHNIGFKVIDAIKEDWRISTPPINKFNAEIYTHFKGEKKILLIKPITYMNLSGSSVASIVSFYKINASHQLVVILDDMDLSPGKLRIRKSGSSGGHKGLSSIIENLGTNDFIRFRIGIGKPEGMSGESYVLSEIPESQKQAFETAITNTVVAIELVIDGKIIEAMNRFNSGQ